MTTRKRRGVVDDAELEGMDKALMLTTVAITSPPTPIAIGIDPGRSGGLAAIDLLGRYVGSIAMPLTKLSKGTEIDVAAVVAFFTTMAAKGPIHLVAMEKVHSMPRDGVASAFSFGVAMGEVRGVIKTLSHPLELPTPQAWQKAILHGTQSTKADAIAFVKRRFPSAVLLATARSKKEHDGIADAICIAEWARCRALGIKPD